MQIIVEDLHRHAAYIILSWLIDGEYELKEVGIMAKLQNETYGWQLSQDLMEDLDTDVQVFLLDSQVQKAVKLAIKWYKEERE